MQTKKWLKAPYKIVMKRNEELFPWEGIVWEKGPRWDEETVWSTD